MGASRRILVVCEDAATLDRLGCHLGEQGYAVQCAATLREALRYAESWVPELVISEYILGELRGLELCEILRRQLPRARFILITPPGETPDYARATRNRVIAYLGKPFNPEDLMHFVTGAFSVGEGQVNRREHSRHSFTVETQLSLINPFDNSESRPIASLMRDVSRSGITLIVRQLLPAPAMLRITFHLSGQQNPFPLLAKSMSCTLTQIPGVYRLGAKFIGLLPEELERAFERISADAAGRGQKDIFMGKSFREAALEWIENHREDMGAEGVELSPRLMAQAVHEFSQTPSGEERP